MLRFDLECVKLSCWVCGSLLQGKEVPPIEVQRKLKLRKSQTKHLSLVWRSLLLCRAYIALGRWFAVINQQSTKCQDDDDLICTTPRLCQNNMTPAALRGRGTTSAYKCFPATGLYFKSKVLASVGRGSTETTRLQHGSSVFGDTRAHAKGGGGGSSDKHGYMAFLILAKWEWQVEDLCHPDNAPC